MITCQTWNLDYKSIHIRLIVTVFGKPEGQRLREDVNRITRYTLEAINDANQKPAGEGG